MMFMDLKIYMYGTYFKMVPLFARCASFFIQIFRIDTGKSKGIIFTNEKSLITTSLLLIGALILIFKNRYFKGNVMDEKVQHFLFILTLEDRCIPPR